MGSMGMERMGPSIERMASGMDMNRGYRGYAVSSSHMGGGISDRSAGPKAGCQIFVRNVSSKTCPSLNILYGSEKLTLTLCLTGHR